MLHPPTQEGSQRCYFSKQALSASCGAGPAALQGEGGELLRAPPLGQPFERVITVACITWVTADATWSHLMKPFKQRPPFMLGFY